VYERVVTAGFFGSDALCGQRIGVESTAAGRIHRQAVRHIELARPLALLAPLLDVLAVLVELDDAVVGVAAVAIGDEDVAVGRHQDVGRCVERILCGPGDAGLAERHEKLAVLIELHDGVTLAVVLRGSVGHPDVVVPVDMQAVRKIDHAPAEALYQLAFFVELHDRIELRVRTRPCIFATVERPDALAVAIDIKADDRAPFAPIRKLGPAICEFVRIGRLVGTIH